MTNKLKTIFKYNNHSTNKPKTPHCQISSKIQPENHRNRQNRYTCTEYTHTCVYGNLLFWRDTDTKMEGGQAEVVNWVHTSPLS